MHLSNTLLFENSAAGMFDVQQVVPKFGKTNLMFVDLGVNINGTY